jgi:hypothetical protein
MIFSDARRLLGLKAYPIHISLQFLLVEPYICEMTDDSVYIDEIAGQYAISVAMCLSLRERVDSDAEAFDRVLVIRDWLG